MQLNITIEVWKKEKWFVARCPELDFVSQGETRDEARNNLLEVTEIQFEEMADMGTLEDYLAECRYEKRTDMFVPLYKKIARQFIAGERTEPRTPCPAGTTENSPAIHCRETRDN